MVPIEELILCLDSSPSPVLYSTTLLIVKYTSNPDNMTMPTIVVSTKTSTFLFEKFQFLICRNLSLFIEDLSWLNFVDLSESTKEKFEIMINQINFQGSVCLLNVLSRLLCLFFRVFGFRGPEICDWSV